MPPYIDVALKSRQSLFEKDFLQDVCHTLRKCFFKQTPEQKMCQIKKEGIFMRQESFKMERPGLVKPGDKVQITEYQSYMNYSYIIEPAVAMSGCYPNSQRIKAKEGTIVSVEKAPLSGYVVIAEFEE